MRRPRDTHMAAAAALAAGVLAVGSAGGALGDARSRISEWRRHLREERAAARLAAEGSGTGEDGDAPRAARFRVDCASPGRPISPLVYGIGTYFADEGRHQRSLGATARRWGGNHASRYNWELHAWNLDRDWFFHNAPVRSAESFLEENRALGFRSALTLPILGWVAKDATSAAFPESVHGPQTARADDHPDAGSGVRPDGSEIPSPPPEATSVPCPPSCVEAWVRRLRERRESGQAAVDLYILDNEPMIWHRTHRDVRPEPLGYDELIERTIAYGTAVRRADPDAVIAGPAEWGWLNWHFSAVDVEAGTRWRPDRLRHGNVPLLPWYLRRLREHEARTGVRVLDVVDVHFYPAAGLGVGLRGAIDPAAAALRIRSTRSLWDPSYVDESWIDEPMQVLPLLRRWIEENYPGRRISIGEWSFGGEGHMSGGLAVAEALGRFGAEGVYAAFYWTYPADRSPAYWAFRAYRDFDGRGGRFLDVAAPVQGTARLASLFASRDEGGRRVVAVLLNLHPRSPLHVEIDLGSCGPPASVRALSFASGADGFAPRAASATRAGTVALEAQPYSITVIDARAEPAAP